MLTVWSIPNQILVMVWELSVGPAAVGESRKLWWIVWRIYWVILRQKSAWLNHLARDWSVWHVHIGIVRCVAAISQIWRLFTYLLMPVFSLFTWQIKIFCANMIVDELTRIRGHISTDSEFNFKILWQRSGRWLHTSVCVVKFKFACGRLESAEVVGVAGCIGSLLV